MLLSTDLSSVYQPILFDINKDLDHYQNLLSDKSPVIIDGIYNQLKELVKCLNPSIRIEETDYEQLILNHLSGKSIFEYGLWVYYPWKNTVVHLLPEEEFFLVRTNRNQNKITREEQQLLRTKKIGIVGLSVGQSIALALAMERTCGELRLADFDTAELSNLNRLRTGVDQLGLRKTVIAAREIAEIDPFIKIKLFSEGLTEDNIHQFFTSDGNLDLFVEVCDGIDIKLKSRVKAKELKIPVVMDTNDRGMLDIERFDLEPERSIFHGLLDQFSTNGTITLTSENRQDILKSIVSFDDLSIRMKQSMIEIGKTINTWPQLASSVVLGGAITTDISRKILLNQHQKSGRFYVDLDEIFESQ